MQIAMLVFVQCGSMPAETSGLATHNMADVC